MIYDFGLLNYVLKRHELNSFNSYYSDFCERQFDCYESAYEIHSANRAFESWIAESLHGSRR